MRLIIEESYDRLSEWAGNYVAARINEANPTEEHPFVLGMPYGQLPAGHVPSVDRTEPSG